MPENSNATTPVPVLDLKTQYLQIAGDLEGKVLSVLRSGSYILGQFGVELEQELANLCGVKFGIGVANCTDALILSLWAADVGPGDEVITPSFTFAATVEAIVLRGARPVLVDVDPVTFNIDPQLIEAAITRKTKAILPVHLYGQPADMDPILAIADRHGLLVIEDNAQAIGATYKSRNTGNLSDLACISFYPTKNLGAAGDAGMIVTNDAELAERLRKIRAHGSKQRYYHDEIGVNSRLDEVQAAVLLAKLPHLRAWNERRNQLAQLYTRLLKRTPGIVTPAVMLRCTHVWHQYTVRIAGADRDDVKKELALRDIGSMCYYPVPLHLQPAFANLGYKRGDLPVSEQLAREVLSLPMYPELSEEQVTRVARALTEILTSRTVSVSIPTTVNHVL